MVLAMVMRLQNVRVNEMGRKLKKRRSASNWSLLQQLQEKDELITRLNKEIKELKAEKEQLEEKEQLSHKK